MPEPTSSDVQRHANHLGVMSRPGGSLRATGERATVSNSDWFIDGEARIGRRRLHAEILAEFRDEKQTVRLQKRAIVLAGPPGAGKSTVLAKLVTDLGGNMGEWRVVDADHFKEVLLRQALGGGSYDSWLVPPDVAGLRAGGEQFYPLELAALVHEESSRLALMARRQAIEAGEQLVVDLVLKDPENAIALGRLLEDAGYEVTVVEVEVSLEQSLARTRGRWENGYRRAERGEAGAELGGRWVPSEYPESLHQDGTVSSRCLVSARVLAD